MGVLMTLNKFLETLDIYIFILKECKCPNDLKRCQSISRVKSSTITYTLVSSTITYTLVLTIVYCCEDNKHN